MDREEKKLAEAAASLTLQDFRYLQEHGMVPDHVDQAALGEDRKSASCAATRKAKKGRKRRHVKHEWPEVGTILEADYHSVHYEAEVIAAPRYRSGKAVRILTGPGAGRTCRSLSGAMLKATEAQRKEQGLGKKGVANGWDFWEVEHEQNN